MKGLESIMYAIQLKDMDNSQLFDECMNHLYPNTELGTRKGCLVHELLERIEPSKEDSIDFVIEEVCESKNITPRLALSKRRDADLVEARVKIARRAYEKGFTSTQIGNALNRDHSTILHYLDHYKMRNS